MYSLFLSLARSLTLALLPDDALFSLERDKNDDQASSHLHLRFTLASYSLLEFINAVNMLKLAIHVFIVIRMIYR